MKISALQLKTEPLVFFMKEFESLTFYLVQKKLILVTIFQKAENSFHIILGNIFYSRFFFYCYVFLIFRITCFQLLKNVSEKNLKLYIGFFKSRTF